MLAKIVAKLEKTKSFIEKFLPWIFLIYFALVFAPYISAKVPALNSFFMGTTTKLLYRGFTCILFGVFCLLLWAIYKPKIKYWVIIGSSLLFIIYLISVFISPSSLSYVTFTTTMKVDFHILEMGNYSYITYTFSFLADLIFFILFINFIPASIKKVSDFYPTLFFIVGVMIFCCFYSFIFERDGIIRLLRGESEYNVTVSCLFHNKNAYGLYLFIASFACAFIFFTSKRKLLKLVFIPHLLFIVMSYLILCKSSFVSNFVLLLGCIVYILFVTFENRKRQAIIFLSALAVLLVSFILLVTVPAFHVGPFASLSDSISKVFQKLFGGLSQRMERWSMIRYVITGPYKVVGGNDTLSAYGLDIMLQIEGGTNFTDFHSGYVSWYASHGILGSIIYFAFFVYLFILIFKIIAVDKKNGCLLLILYLSSLIFIVPETYTLFVSISSYAFLLNLILVGYTYFLVERNYPNGVFKNPERLEKVSL